MRHTYVLKRLILVLSIFILLLTASATVAEAASFDRKVAEQVNKITGKQIKSGDEGEERLEKLFTYMEQEYNVFEMQEFIPYEDWEKEYAVGLYTAKEGNCYHFAAAYAFLAKKATDFEVRIGLGKTNTLTEDNLQNHAWVEVKVYGQWYICDTFLDKVVGDCSGNYFLMGKEDAEAIYDGFKDVEYIKIVRKKQWLKEDGKRYYLKSDWEFPTGSYKINGVYYIFDSKGMLLQPKKNSLVKVGKNTYFVNTKGKAVSGWHIIKGKLYNIKQTGAARKDTEYEGITFTSTGAAKENEACKLKKKVMQIVASITEEDMTKPQKLLVCWNYMVNKRRFRYVSKYPNLHEKGWTRKTAYNMLSTKTGNCYSFACAFAALTEEIGYKPYVVCARISGRRDRARDGLTRHAWVRLNGMNYDPEAQFAGWRRGIYNSKGYPIRHVIQKIVLY